MFSERLVKLESRCISSQTNNHPKNQTLRQETCAMTRPFENEKYLILKSDLYKFLSFAAAGILAVFTGLSASVRRISRKTSGLILVAATAGILMISQTCPAEEGTAAASLEETETTFEEDEAPAHPHAHGHPVDAAVAAKDKFNIKLYLDFMYETALGDDTDSPLRDPENGSFNSNHTYLLITANPNDRMRVGFDISFKDYYELEYAVTPKLFVKGGLIFLPFGDFRYHAIYGGKVYSLDNDLFPNWFTDYGLALEHDALDLETLNLRYGLFVSNGFQEGTNGDVNMNDIGFTQDNNSDKAFGGRVKATIKGGYTVTASAMLDRWSDEGNASLRLLALEFSSTRGLMKFPVLDKLNVKLGYLDNHVENDRAEEAVLKDYNAYGTHAELSYQATDRLKLTCRMGEVDPNEDVKNEMDQQNYNIGGMFTVNHNLHLMAMVQKNEEKYVKEIDNDYAMVKAIVEF